MTDKERFLSITDRKEYERVRYEIDIDIFDKDIIAHMNELYPPQKDNGIVDGFIETVYPIKGK